MFTRDTLIEASKASPPVAVGGLSLAGVSLSDAVLAATLIYTVLQIYFLLRDKWYIPRKVQHGRKR